MEVFPVIRLSSSLRVQRPLLTHVLSGPQHGKQAVASQPKAHLGGRKLREAPTSYVRAAMSDRGVKWAYTL